MNKLRESLNKLICEGALTSSQIINDFRVRYIHFFFWQDVVRFSSTKSFAVLRTTEEQVRFRIGNTSHLPRNLPFSKPPFREVIYKPYSTQLSWMGEDKKWTTEEGTRMHFARDRFWCQAFEFRGWFLLHTMDNKSLGFISKSDMVQLQQKDPKVTLLNKGSRKEGKS